MQPTTEVVRIETQSLLNIVSNGDGTLSGDGNQGDLRDGDEVLSRGSFFDDSDDEW